MLVAIRGLTAVGEQPSNRAKKERATGLVTVQVSEVLACHISPFSRPVHAEETVWEVGLLKVDE